MTDPEYRLDPPFSTNKAETKADRAALWHEYLHTRQGSVGLAFRDDDFRSTAVAQSVGKYQIVQFETAALDYQRSARDVRTDGDNSHRLLIPVAGEFKFAQGESRDIIRPGKVVFFHWGQPLYMTHDEPIRALIMTVPESSVDLTRARDAPLTLDERRPSVRALQRQVRQLADSTEAWNTADFTATFSSALTLLEGALSPAGPIAAEGRPKDAERARHFMEQYADDPAVTPETIAGLCGWSLATLHTVLKETEGYTPGAMLRMIRLRRARQRLATPLPVDMDRIAYETGFSTTRRFREAFLRQFGQTPVQMREELFGMSTKLRGSDARSAAGLPQTR